MHKRKLAERPASVLSRSHVSHSHTLPGLPVPTGCSTCLSGAPPIFLPAVPCWPWLLLLDGPSPLRKQHVLKGCLCASSKPPPQTGQDTPRQLPHDSQCSGSGCLSLLITLFQLSPGRTCWSSVSQNHLKSLSKHRLLGPPNTYSPSGRNLRICISNYPQVMLMLLVPRLPSENHGARSC